MAWLSSRAGLLAWSLILGRLGLIRLGAGAQYASNQAALLQGPGGSLLAPWLRWDAMYYVRIASVGYVSPDLSAFHPLYPLLGRLVAPLFGGDTFLGLLFVSNCAALLAFALLYDLVSETLGNRVARQAVIALILFPSAFFLFAPYAESLTLLLILAAYHAARRSHWRRALVAGVAAGLSHPMALPLTALLAWEVGMRRPRIWSLRAASMSLLPAAPFLGTGSFLIWQRLRGLPSWPVIHHNLWGVAIRWPWEALAEIPASFRSAYFPVTGWINLATLILATIVIVWGASRLPRPFVAFQLTAILFLLSVDVVGEPLSSFTRHALMMFPAFVTLGIVCNTPARRLTYAAIALGLQLYFAAMFLQWIWVG